MKLFNSLFLFVHVITILGAAMSTENEGSGSLENSSEKENQGGSKETSESQGRRKLASTRGFKKQGKSGDSNFKGGSSKGEESSNQPRN
ncbi:hypothetical protein NBO_7g0057 [Nosema bombycis CQ1]|uniref:Uncharacterized protein n=1 Tax=Nosema bombycis (strain CQ1 / CVCC 102059) TaxID=578461 RepID=R0KU20_NOSB1|nr:hypothetical protein NBO_62g0017 [Nosema bombycis CQ1]EOB15236.1 hypothetical protein NBO_7g0057 [Nosema bombycis CQ1]|eukprot:EOB13727.1 hypothetical protein NBO_62g0017 [Nosema bombycis CQ1]